MEPEEDRKIENVVIGILIILVSVAVLIYLNIFFENYLGLFDRSIEYFSLSYMLTTILIGFTIGFGLSLALNATFKNIAGGVTILMFPVILLAFLMEWSGSSEATFQGAAEVMIWLSLIMGITMGIFSSSLVMDGYRAMTSRR